MQTRTEFVARKIGADKVIYQPLENLKRAVRMGNPKLTHFCAACFDGLYPTGDVTPEVLQEIEKDRRDKQLELSI
jgi:amidophosphoribosyltransferase